MKSAIRISIIVLSIVLLLPAVGSAIGGALNPDPPSETVRLVFIHHSTGENWLVDENGGLGIALRDARYFVSDTNYGWGPADTDVGYDTIGDHTDIGHWYNWFSGPHRNGYMTALYAHGDTWCGYSRREDDPGGENRIVMFKSCFPNSNLSGSPTDPIPPIASNPLKGNDSGSEQMTLANAKGIYVEILKYFATRQDKLFVVVVQPPLSRDESDAEHAANARALATWLQRDWLADYPYRNVFVFDFFDVLTSNGSSTRTGDDAANDAGWADGNHHRYRNGAIEHLQTVANDHSAYRSDRWNSHPTQAGNRKAVAEFVPLLNIAYHCWHGDGGCPNGTTACSLGCSASASPTSVAVGGSVAFTASATATGCAGTVAYDWDFGDGSSHVSTQNPTHVYGAAGSYGWSLTATVDGQSCQRSGTITATSGPGPTNVYVVPAISHAPGMYESQWRADVVALNPGTSTAHLTFVYSSVDGATDSRTATVDPKATREWGDLLVSLFGYDPSGSFVGALTISSDRPVLLSSRSFNQTTDGTFGAYMPAISPASALGSGRTGYLLELKKGATFRTNIGVANLGTQTANVQVRLFGEGGAQVGQPLGYTVPPGALVVKNDAFALASAGDQAIAYATVETSTAGAAVWAYASVNDRVTSDPTIYPLLIP
jgi:PKD repeat protein